MESAPPSRNQDQALAACERRFRLLADHAPVLIWRSGRDRLCDWFNKPWLDFTGRSMEQEMGHGWASGVHPDDRDRCLHTYFAAFDAGEPFTMDYRLRRHDGVYRWIRDNGAPFHDEDGSLAGYFGSGIDITDHIENEIELRRALAQADSYDQRQKQAQWRQDLLIGELNHRVKNTLATVQSIAAQSFRETTDVETGLSVFEGRLIALSRAHDVLTRESWLGASLLQLVHAAIEPFTNGGGGRFAIAGPSISVSPKMTVALAMALHELCTNAVKYGALSASDGRIDISWQVHDGAEQMILELRWVESGGPPVAAPTRKGFGTRLIERGLAREFGGSTELAFDPAGLICLVRVPLAAEELKLVGGLVAPHR